MANGNSEPEVTDGLKAFGAVLRAFRERSGLTQEAFAEKVRYSPHQVASIERGRRFPARDFVDRADETLDADGILKAAARPLSRKKGIASWFQQWAQLEEEAITLYVYECRVIPGLLQSEGYIRAASQSNVPSLNDQQIERQVAALVDRQRIMTEKPNVEFSFIVEQALLERRTGGSDVTRQLIDHLLACARLRNVELQIMPVVQEWHAGLHGPIQLAETPENQWFGYSEAQRGSVLLSAPKEVSVLLQRYGRLRSQALRHDDSASLLERMRGEL